MTQPFREPAKGPYVTRLFVFGDDGHQAFVDFEKVLNIEYANGFTLVTHSLFLGRGRTENGVLYENAYIFSCVFAKF